MVELGRALRRAFPDAPFACRDVAAATSTPRLAASRPSQQLLLAIDQFEEVFNATRDDAERSAFLELLTANRRGLKVVVAMRADHYGDAPPTPPWHGCSAAARCWSGR